MEDDEEKEMELEALESIFMEDLTVKTAPSHYELRLVPNPDSDEPEDNIVGVTLEVRLPAAYPDEVPTLLVRPIVGVTSKDLTHITKLIRDEAEASLGTPMIFTITSVIKEWLDDHNEEDVVVEEVEELEYIDDGDGTPVTPANYELWWTSFLAEMDTGDVKEVKETGKEFFHRRTVPELSAVEGAAAPAVDWSAFDEDEIDDLDDLEFSDSDDEEDEED
eukprot:TRINITY_DN6997_c0_g1_i1.p2 TRINITY_DN6997_c0_g1~~TRINITY_DN6997_c0_g1_i1.p2  ORF type:complete len:220 (-),score=79.14 TRINITY_DN6997_c0_g1_i1:389-1048(-)